MIQVDYIFKFEETEGYFLTESYDEEDRPSKIYAKMVVSTYDEDSFGAASKT